MSFLFVIHFAVTWALAGLIWTVQIVQYPNFHRVGADHFRAYHAAHMRGITLVVGPLILAEAGTAGWLFFSGERHGLLLVSFILMVLNWVSTWFVQVPLHEKLVDGYERETCLQLTRTNWIRTLAWTLRGVLVSAAAYFSL